MGYQELLIPVTSVEEGTALKDQIRACALGVDVFCTTRAKQTLRGIFKDQFFVCVGGYLEALRPLVEQNVGSVLDRCYFLDEILAPRWQAPGGHDYKDIFDDFYIFPLDA